MILKVKTTRKNYINVRDYIFKNMLEKNFMYNLVYLKKHFFMILMNSYVIFFFFFAESEEYNQCKNKFSSSIGFLVCKFFNT